MLIPSSVLLFAALGVATSCAGLRHPTPAASRAVIDVHLHAGPTTPGTTYGESQARGLLEELDKHGVVLAILGGPPADVQRMRSAAPGRIIGSVAFPCSDGRDPNLFECFASGADWPEIDWLRGEVDAGRVGALGELYNVYAGVSPADARMIPYFDLAAEYDLVVLAHAESGPPPAGRAPGCCPAFDGELGHPALFEAPLSRHPQLRLILLHVFRPSFVQEAIQLMHRYPNVMVETSPMTRVSTDLVHAAVGGSLNVIESATFLSTSQKRAILYDNAARLLRLDGVRRGQKSAVTPTIARRPITAPP